MNKKKKYRNHPPVPFWDLNKTSTPKKLKLPKIFRKKVPFVTVKRDRKTGEYYRV